MIAQKLAIAAQLTTLTDLPVRTILRLRSRSLTGTRPLSPCLPFTFLITTHCIAEYQPLLHRATPPVGGLALDPINPKSTNVASETLDIRHEGFSPSRATHTDILTSVRSTPVYTVGFTAHRTLPYQITMYKYIMNSLSSAPYLSLDHFRRRGFHPVSCYAFFKRWLLLSQLPGCLKTTTSFPTEYGFGGLRRKSGVFPFSHTSLAPHD